MDTTRQRLRHRHTPVEKANYKQKVIKQAMVRVTIILITFGIKYINVPAAQTLTKNLKNTLYYTVDYQATTKNIIESIKKIPQLWNKDAKDNDNNDANTEISPEIQPAQTDTAL